MLYITTDLILHKNHIIYNMLRNINLLLINLLVIISFLVFQIISKGKKMEIVVTSAAFKEGELIPSKFTCDGINISPPVKWKTEINGIKSFALISDDPDAQSGDWVHWVVFNIPSDIRELREDCKANRNLPDEALMGTNDFRTISYGGPCPPSGTHRYLFKIYALDVVLHLKAGATKNELLDAMKGHILAQGQLTGLYKRKR
jgi:Raf kinase inhibitor-like YbhB/YbcL family protein